MTSFRRRTPRQRPLTPALLLRQAERAGDVALLTRGAIEVETVIVELRHLLRV